MKSINVLIITVIFAISAIGTFAFGKDVLIKSHKFNIKSQTLLEIKIEGSEIEITPGNNDEILVEIFGNQRVTEHFEFIFKSEDNLIKVIGERKINWNFFRSLNLIFKIKIPSNFNINASTSGGDIKVGGISGNVSMNTSGGDIWADEFSGMLKARTSGGDIKIFANNAQIDAKTSGGDIKLELSGESKGVDLVTSGGDIKIFIPQNFNAELEAITLGGDIRSQFELNKVRTLAKNKVYGIINSGGEKISAKTSGGDISINILK
jgi:hypothetical protein